MWIFTILPEWLIHATLIVGVASFISGFVLGFIPLVKQYVVPMRVIGLFIICVCLFLEGGLMAKKEQDLKIKDLQVKLAEAEAKSQQENVKIVEKVVTKREYYRLRGKDIIQYVDREVTKYDNQCVIPKEFVKAHNDAAEKQK